MVDFFVSFSEPWCLASSVNIFRGIAVFHIPIHITQYTLCKAYRSSLVLNKKISYSPVSKKFRISNDHIVRFITSQRVFLIGKLWRELNIEFFPWTPWAARSWVSMGLLSKSFISMENYMFFSSGKYPM